jgi:hypothetical protein
MAELKLWEAASNYMGEGYPDYYVLLGRTRDSTLADEANFEAALKELGGDNAPGVKVPRSGHWAVGWIETILIHKDNKKAVQKAQDIANRLADYPILDDDLYYRKEYDAAIENIKDAGYSHGLSDSEAVKVYMWLSDNGNDMENTDDTGFYPNDEELESAVKAIRSKAGREKYKTTKKPKSKKRNAGIPGISSVR